MWHFTQPADVDEDMTNVSVTLTCLSTVMLAGPHMSGFTTNWSSDQPLSNQWPCIDAVSGGKYPVYGKGRKQRANVQASRENATRVMTEFPEAAVVEVSKGRFMIHFGYLASLKLLSGLANDAP